MICRWFLYKIAWWCFAMTFLRELKKFLKFKQLKGTVWNTPSVNFFLSTWKAKQSHVRKLVYTTKKTPWLVWTLRLTTVFPRSLQSEIHKTHARQRGFQNRKNSLPALLTFGYLSADILTSCQTDIFHDPKEYIVSLSPIRLPLWWHITHFCSNFDVRDCVRYRYPSTLGLCIPILEMPNSPLVVQFEEIALTLYSTVIQHLFHNFRRFTSLYQ